MNNFDFHVIRKVENKMKYFNWRKKYQQIHASKVPLPAKNGMILMK